LIVFCTILHSLGLWMVGTFSYAYHGGIQCGWQAREKHFDLWFMHNLGAGLVLGAMVPYLLAVAASLASLHSAGVVSWPRRFQIMVASIFCGIVVLSVVSINENAKGSPSLTLSICQYSLVLCIFLAQLLFLYSWCGCSIDIVLSKAEG